jgi:hypothetical protein
MTAVIDAPGLNTPADSALRLRGVVDGPRELIALLRLLQNSAVDGRLCLATDAWSGEVFLDHGRLLAATCGVNQGAAVLTAMLQDPSGKTFSLQPWALLEDVSANFGNDVLSRFEQLLRLADPAPVDAAQGQPKSSVGVPGATSGTDRNDLIATLASEVLGRVRWPIDALEVTALLESLGITDEVAARRYGARDVFLLAEEVHGRFALRAEHRAE